MPEPLELLLPFKQTLLARDSERDRDRNRDRDRDMEPGR